MPSFTKLKAVAAAIVLTCTFATAQQAPKSIVGSAPLGGLSGATSWINSKPLTAKDLKGKVVLIDFWTYSCINCIRSVPYIRAWADKYKDAGLVVIGVHSPEFDFEKEIPNIQRAVNRFQITYPIAVDNKLAVWNAFHNNYWPAHYFLDANGKVRFEHFGEGEYDQSEKWIQQLLAERNSKPMPNGNAAIHANGNEAAADTSDVKSPETYIGYDRATTHFVSPGGIKYDDNHLYAAPTNLNLNDWGLIGQWADLNQVANLTAPGGKIIYRFHARDLHLVLGTSGHPVHFRVTIDGKAPGDNHGVDTDANGNGIITDHRLYQLIRQKGPITDHTFVIEFQDAGAQAFAFTFG